MSLNEDQFVELVMDRNFGGARWEADKPEVNLKKFLLAVFRNKERDRSELLTWVLDTNIKVEYWLELEAKRVAEGREPFRTMPLAAHPPGPIIIPYYHGDLSRHEAEILLR